MSDDGILCICVAITLCAFAGCAASENFKQPRSNFMAECAKSRIICTDNGFRQEVIGPMPGEKP